MAISTIERKLRRSDTREHIYSYLCSVNTHPSAEDVYEELKNENPHLSLGTVYRNLKQLEEVGKIVRVTCVEHKERYDANCEDHVHFVCNCCGKVMDIMDVDVQKSRNLFDMDGALIERINLVLSGTCKDCAKK